MTSAEPVDVLIVTAADGEDIAVRAVKEGAVGPWLEMDLGGDYQFPVWQQRYRAEHGGELRVASSHTYKMGVEAAGNAAGWLIGLLRPRTLAMCGVCAGNPSRTRMGDVLIADCVWNYEVGDTVCQTDGGSQVCHPDVMTNLLGARWDHDAHSFRVPSDARWLATRPRSLDFQELWLLWELLEQRDPLLSQDRSRLCAGWAQVVKRLQDLEQVRIRGGCLKLSPKGRERIEKELLLHVGQIPDEEEWRIHVGPLATGARLVKDISIWERLRNQKRSVLGLDMESSVIGMAAHIAEIPMIVVKGIMDYADYERSQDYRAFAARAAAEVLIGFLRKHFERQDDPVTSEGIPHKLPPRGALFVGRDWELADVHGKLDVETERGVPRQVAVHGQGGLGKSALAVEYAWRYLDEYPGGVFFIRGDLKTIEAEIAAIAPELRLAEQRTSALTARAVVRHLEKGRPSLLIVEDVDDPEEWAQAERSAMLLPAGNCRRLVTTRLPSLCGVPMYQLEPLSREESVRLLARYREDASCPKNQETVGAIVDRLDGFTLAIKLVGVYMSVHPGLTWKNYSEDLHKRGLKAFGGTADTEHLKSVIDDLLGTLETSRRRVLEFAALLPEDQIVTDWLSDLLESEPGIDVQEPGYGQHPARGVLNDLLSAGLLRSCDENQQIVSMHRVLRSRLLELLDTEPGFRDRLVDRIASFTESWAERAKDALTNRAARGELTPLIGVCGVLGLRERYAEAVCLANWLHAPLRELGRVEDGERLMREAVELGRRVFEATHPQLAITYSNLAGVEEDLGNLAEAKRLLLDAVRIMTERLPPDHPALATAYSNLGCVEQKRGHPDKAVELLHRSLEIDEINADHDDLRRAKRYTILGLIERDRWDLENADKYLRRALDLRKGALLEDHPALAEAYSNFGLLRLDQGNLEEAYGLLKKAIDIWGRIYQYGHPSLAVGCTNLAAIEQSLGTVIDKQRHLQEAKYLQHRAITIWEQALSPGHPNLAEAYSNYAIVLKDLDELDEAEQWVNRAIGIQEQSDRSPPAALARSYEILAGIQRRQGQLREAQRTLRKAYEIYREVYGPEHRDA